MARGEKAENTPKLFDKRDSRCLPEYANPSCFVRACLYGLREDEKGRAMEEERFVFIIQGRSGFQLGSVGCSGEYGGGRGCWMAGRLDGCLARRLAGWLAGTVHGRIPLGE